jgi:hypothetical protein
MTGQRKLDSSRISGHTNQVIGSVQWSNPNHRTVSIEICGLRGIVILRDLEILLSGAIDSVPIKSRSKSMVRLILYTEDLEQPLEAWQRQQKLDAKRLG